MIYTIVLEMDEQDTDISAWCEVDSALATTVGESVEEVVANIRMLIEDFKENTFKDDSKWQSIDVSAIEFDFQYSMYGFFETHKAIKIGEIAKLAGLNPALVRSYACGDKNPSLEQAQKIERAVHLLAQSLLLVKVVPKTVRPAA